MSKPVEKKKETDFTKKGFTVSEVDAIKAFFDSLDFNGTGKISLRDLKSNMLGIGYEIKSDVIFEMLNHLNREGITEVTFEELLDFMSTKPKPEESQEEIMKIFELFDEEKLGYITHKQFYRVCRELGYNLSAGDVQEIITTSTPREDGKLTFDDFYAIMTKSSFP